MRGLSLGTLALAFAGASLAEEMSFNRDIRPILSDNCFACHGPDKKARKAGRRFDTSEGAREEIEGVRAIVPGDLAQSDLAVRIASSDPDEVMPPPKSEKKLTPEQIAKVKQWITQGAKYEPHWSFIPPRRSAVPGIADCESRIADWEKRDPAIGAKLREREAELKAWPRNPLDHFILDRLLCDGLAPSPEASPVTLCRRLYFDLTGLPPTPAEVDAFLQSTIRNPNSAIEDLVDRLLASPRYGERMTRDWLDLSRYADTHGYHLDSGRDMWLWRDWVIKAFNDNQPFDQFTIDQIAGDLLPNATDAQKIATGFHRNAMINFEGGAIAEEYLAQYIKDRVATTATVYLGLTLQCAECHDHKFDPVTQKEFYQMYAFFNAVPEKGIDGSKGNAEPLLRVPSAEDRTRLASLERVRTDAEKALAEASPQIDAEQREWEQIFAPETDPEDDPTRGPLPENIMAILAIAPEMREAKQRDELRKHYREKVSGQWGSLNTNAAQAKKAVEDFQKTIPTVMVMAQAEKPRESFLLNRGQYDQPGEKVEPGVPASLPPLPPGAPRNRLGFAQWLVDPQHPLVARVTVNRFWQMIMGTGIVKTAQDFGSQAEWPSHPELLDWLAVEFREPSVNQPSAINHQPPHQWDMKHLLKLIVTSATYRQSSRLTPELRERDPQNRLYARGPRFRLGAEEIRDTALSVSGLLAEKIGGPSVRPYQPAGLWEELSSRLDGDKFTAQKFVQDHSESLYRRTLYTFWKRTSPPPSLTTFDAPDREKCLVNRDRTNTPLQALVLMNDPTYVEAARKLAERMMTESGTAPAERVAFAFRLATARMPSESETRALVQLYEKQHARFAAAPEQADALLAVGEAPRNAKLDPIDLAAWASVASTILNLDETITKG
jgi:mono/diheme cytochrome c family protein